MCYCLSSCCVSHSTVVGHFKGVNYYVRVMKLDLFVLNLMFLPFWDISLVPSVELFMRRLS